MNRHRHIDRLGRIALALSLLASAWLWPARPARAAAIAVNSTADTLTAGDGQCTLREAIMNANANADTTGGDCAAGTGDDSITLGVAGAYTLAISPATAAPDDGNGDGDLDVAAAGALSISGGGAASYAIDGGGLDRVLHVLSGANLTLSGVTVRGGVSPTVGGGLLNFGALTVNGVVFTNNQASGSGAGGGLAVTGGTVTLSGVTFDNNTADQGGGLFVAAGGDVTVDAVLFSGNTAGTLGGALYHQSGILRLTNVTARLNSSGGDGGGLYNESTLLLLNVTLSQNTAAGNGGGVFGLAPPFARNSILAGNSAASGAECGGALSSQGNNFFQSTAGCSVSLQSGDLTGPNPLGAFGGQTYVLNAGSAAIDAGTNTNCPAVDQVGNTRPKDGNGDTVAVCDMGAYEAPTVLPTPTFTPSPTFTLPPGVTPSATFTPSPTAVLPTSTPQAGASPVAPLPTPVGVQPVGSGGGSFRCGDWIVTIPAGAVPDGGGLHCGDFDPNVAPRAPAGYQLRQHVINVNVYDNNGSWITRFDRALTFCYPFSLADLEAAGGDAGNLVVQTAPIGGTWSPLATTLGGGGRQACAQATHLTLFELSARLGAASAGTYVVQPGDTLFSLARRFGTTVAALRALNGLTSDRIDVGQALRIPGQTPPATAPPPAGGTGSVYIVQPGDNLFRIGLRFGTTVAALQAANGLGGSIRIYAGQRLIIPSAGGAPTAPAPSATPAPAGSSLVHVVQPGENLFRIALRYRTTVAALQAANNLGSSILIYVGQRLTVPAGGAPTATQVPLASRSPTPAATRSVYLVRTGDTLFRIALRFGTTVSALQAANNLSGTLIYVGQRLVIP